MNQYALDILTCQPDYASSSKYIVYTTPTKLAVVKGAEELLSKDLKDLVIPINEAQKTTFVLPAHSVTHMPANLINFDFCGLTSTGTAIYSAFFAEYNNETYEPVNWVFKTEYDGPQTTATPIDLSSYDCKISFDAKRIDGTNFGMNALTYASVGGGLKLWSVQDGMKLFNNVNSSLPSNSVSSLAEDNLGRIWLGTDKGLVKVTYNGTNFIFYTYNTLNSGLSSDIINDVFCYNDEIIMATENGITIYNHVSDKWKKYTRLNTNVIRSSSFRMSKASENYYVFAAQDGAYILDKNTDVWSKYDSSIAGWSGSNECLSVDLVDTEAFIGTSEDVKTFAIGAASVQTLSTLHGEITSVIYVQGTLAADDKLYCSHRDGFLTIFNSDLVSFTQQIASNLSKMREDFILSTAAGVGVLDINSLTVSYFPSSDTNGDILFTYPTNKQTGMSMDQPIFIGFSKTPDASSLEQHFSSTGLSCSIEVFNDTMAKITCAEFERAKDIHFVISEGLTATDSTFFSNYVDVEFYTEEKAPVNGWHPMLKHMILTGDVNHPIESLVFKNQNNFDVPVTAIIAI